MIKKVRFDEKKLKRYDLAEGKNPVWLDIAIAEPGAVVAFEDWRAEAQSDPGSTWTFTVDEIHVILSGKAEMTYTEPPWHFADSKKTVTMEEGDVYLIPKGTRWSRKVIGTEPYRHICIMMPGMVL